MVTKGAIRTFGSWIAIMVAIFLVFTTWSLASPVGSSPDDDFHLASIWCANESTELCADSQQLGNKQVSAALLQANCFAQQENISAACQEEQEIFAQIALVETSRGNFYGQYPGLFYSVMGLFAGEDIQSSVILMRLFNSLVFVLLIGGIFLCVDKPFRKKIALTWLITLVPLGLFIIPSTNPSSWAVMGVGAAFMSLYTSWKQVGRKRILLNFIYVISVCLAVGARSDGAAFIVVATAAALALQRPLKNLLSWWSVIPVFGVVTAVVVFLRSGQSAVLETGFATSGEAPTYGFVEILFGNILNLPSLWLGAFGSWGLGWLDTQMPAMVWIFSGTTFVCLLFLALAGGRSRELWIFSAIAFTLVIVPLYTLQKSLAPVGAEVQPRYILPLLVLLVAVAILGFTLKPLYLSRNQWAVIALSLSAAQSVALYINLRRYVNGGSGGPNLDADAQWWWVIPVGPMLVWLMGSLAFSFCAYLVLRSFSEKRAAISQEISA
jgi:hypothetical protein